eukprot:COSAG01_NODE_15318_length_1350_cov_1.373301_3_plen_78_part_01
MATPVWSAAYHYGKLSECVQYYQKAMKCMDLVLAKPNQNEEATTLIGYSSGWTIFALDLNCPTALRVALEKAELTWSS